MIQRIQTIWFLLAALSCGLLFYVDLFYVQQVGATASNAIGILDGTAFLFVLSALAILMTLLPLWAIFQFKNRKQQISLSWFSILLSIVFLVLAVWHVTAYGGKVNVEKTSFGIGCFLPLLSLIFTFLAMRGVKNDEKLVRSMDRLR
jgi:uncharacterized membrane protein